jgi:hypothetical protein
MKKISSPLLPFKLSSTEDKITSHSGLGLFGEFLHSQSLSDLINHHVLSSKSNRSYKPSNFIIPLLLMLHGGGRYIEDLREISQDKALLELLQICEVPSSSAVGDWLRFIGNKKRGLSGLSQVNKVINKRGLQHIEKLECTLDIDASQVTAEKRTAKITYKGVKGFMPIAGHISETGMIIADEFREGNVSPGTRNLEFIKQCCRNMPRRQRIRRLRADSASYQASIFNWCEKNNIKFAIGGRMDEAVKTIIRERDASEWQKYQNGSSILKITHCMQKTKKAFDIIIIRRPWQPDLFDEEADDSSRYFIIATNIKGDTEKIIKWYNQRGQASENRIKELKIGFGMEYMPCGTTEANAVYFRIGAIAYNLFRLFKMAALPKKWEKHQVQTIRWKFYQTAGKLIKHSRQVWLKVESYYFNVFQEVRARIRKFALAAI